MSVSPVSRISVVESAKLPGSEIVFVATVLCCPMTGSARRSNPRRKIASRTLILSDLVTTRQKGRPRTMKLLAEFGQVRHSAPQVLDRPRKLGTQWSDPRAVKTNFWTSNATVATIQATVQTLEFTRRTLVAVTYDCKPSEPIPTDDLCPKQRPADRRQ